jgi:hypothetical protein
MMKRNMGTVDRAARFVIGVVMMAVGFSVMSGAGLIVLVVIGAVLFATSVIGWCPLYVPFRFSTQKK